MSADHDRATDVRVGIFVSLGVLTLLGCVFLIGQERHLFERPAYLRALFSNVAGLKVGAPVRLAGVDIGIVSKIDFPEVDPKADQRVMHPISLRNVKPGAKLKLDQTQFESAMNISLSAHDPAGKLHVEVKLEGKDELGEPLSETLVLWLGKPLGIAVGSGLFRSVEQATVVALDQASPDATIRLGFGRARKITVTMRVTGDVLTRIRHDSIARVETMGLLGDKTIEISMGSSRRPQHVDGDVIRSVDGLDINAAMADAKKWFNDVRGFTAEATSMLQGLGDGDSRDNAMRTLASVRQIAEDIREKEGLVHRLIYDEEIGAEANRLVKDLRHATKRPDRTIGQVDAMVGEVRTGDGLVHELVYGEDGKETLQTARGTLAEAQQLLADVKTKEGILHQLIYDADGGDLVTNLNDASQELKTASSDVKLLVADARDVVAGVKKGEGTLGGLIVDPSVYEDLKTLLGNVRRNDALKTLVRYAITRQDAKAAKTGQVTPK